MFLKTFALAVVLVATLAASAGAQSCNASDAQSIANQGYAYLSAQRWSDARAAAGELALYARNCDDPKVGVPSVVHSAYIGAVALHELGDDARSAKAVQLGTAVLELLHKEGGYDSMYDALLPKFHALQVQLKP